MPRTIVITGASSGIGRSTAKAFAARGDNVVLSARRRGVLEGLAAECGSGTLVAPADVTDEHAIDELAQQAVAQFGRIDAWVNCAAVGAFGHFLDVPVRTMRRVVEVDLLGSMIVARAALRVFEAQRSGTLVLVSSTDAAAPVPYLSVYDAAKAGVSGLAMTLRADLKERGVAGVKVVDLRPPSTDTPFYVHAANYVGRKAHAPPPAYDPQTVAEAILGVVDDPEDVKTVGLAAKLQRVAAKALPAAYERVAGKAGEQIFLDEGVALGDGALFAPIPEGVTERQQEARP